MRTNITISLDPAFIARMDAKRGSMPRSRWLEASCDQNATPVIERSPEPNLKNEGPREYIESGGWQRDTREAFASEPVVYKPPRETLAEREIRRQEEAGEA